MKVNLTLELKDVPGQLVKALQPISLHGGNIIKVVHDREGKGKKVPVHLVIEVEDRASFEKITKAIEEEDASILSEKERKERVVVVIIGHVIDKDIRDTIDRINEMPGAMVADLNLTMPDPEDETAALMDIEVDDPSNVKPLFAKLDDIAKEKDLLVIKSLGV